MKSDELDYLSTEGGNTILCAKAIIFYDNMTMLL